jgi:hypothetical protein
MRFMLVQAFSTTALTSDQLSSSDIAVCSQVKRSGSAATVDTSTSPASLKRVFNCDIRST